MIMKRTTCFKYLFLLALGTAAMGLQGCGDDDDDDGGYGGTPELQDALNARYPGAQRVEWDTEGGYWVADFYYNGHETEAWFTRDAAWVRTETTLRYEELPAAVRAGFEASAYAGWRRDNIEKVEQDGMEDYYVVEVEQGGQDVDLHYSADGLLVREITDGTGGTHRPPAQPGADVYAAIRGYIEANYPGASIFEIDREAGGYDAEIVHDGRVKDVNFDSSGAWLYTSWNVRPGELPQAARQAAEAAYPGYRVEDIDYVETPGDDYYDIEMEGPGPDVHVHVTADGRTVAR